MQTISKIFLWYGILWLAASCSDNYLDDTEQQPTQHATSVLYINPASGYTEYTITVANAGNNTYSIGMLPKWLTFKFLKGNFENNAATLKFTVQNVPASFAQGTYESSLTLVIENVGLYIIPVVFVNE